MKKFFQNAAADLPYTLKITPKTGKAIDLAVKAKATADVDCKDGCTVALNGKTQAFDGKAI